MTVVKNSESCNGCLFFSLGERMGICKRFPTAVNKSNEDWCGEWQIKESLAIEAMIEWVNGPEFESPPKKRGRPAKR